MVHDEADEGEVVWKVGASIQPPAMTLPLTAYKGSCSDLVSVTLDRWLALVDREAPKGLKGLSSVRISANFFFLYVLIKPRGEAFECSNHALFTVDKRSSHCPALPTFSFPWGVLDPTKREMPRINSSINLKKQPLGTDY